MANYLRSTTGVSTGAVDLGSFLPSISTTTSSSVQIAVQVVETDTRAKQQIGESSTVSAINTFSGIRKKYSATDPSNTFNILFIFAEAFSL